MNNKLKTPFCFRHTTINGPVLTANLAGFETKDLAINDYFYTLLFSQQKINLTPTKIPLKEC